MEVGRFELLPPCMPCNRDLDNSSRWVPLTFEEQTGLCSNVPHLMIAASTIQEEKQT
jgi:hypothetical protein